MTPNFSTTLLPSDTLRPGPDLPGILYRLWKNSTGTFPGELMSRFRLRKPKLYRFTSAARSFDECWRARRVGELVFMLHPRVVVVQTGPLPSDPARLMLPGTPYLGQIAFPGFADVVAQMNLQATLSANDLGFDVRAQFGAPGMAYAQWPIIWATKGPLLHAVNESLVLLLALVKGQIRIVLLARDLQCSCPHGACAQLLRKSLGTPDRPANIDQKADRLVSDSAIKRMGLLDATLILGLAGRQGLRVTSQFAAGKCAHCESELPPPEQCPRDHDAEQWLAAVGCSPTAVTNPSKRIGLLRRAERYRARVNIYSCPRCGRRVGIGFCR